MNNCLPAGSWPGWLACFITSFSRGPGRRRAGSTKASPGVARPRAGEPGRLGRRLTVVVVVVVVRCREASASTAARRCSTEATEEPRPNRNLDLVRTFSQLLCYFPRSFHLASLLSPSARPPARRPRPNSRHESLWHRLILTCDIMNEFQWNSSCWNSRTRLAFTRRPR